MGAGSEPTAPLLEAWIPAGLFAACAASLALQQAAHDLALRQRSCPGKSLGGYNWTGRRTVGRQTGQGDQELWGNKNMRQIKGRETDFAVLPMCEDHAPPAQFRMGPAALKQAEQRSRLRASSPAAAMLRAGAAQLPRRRLAPHCAAPAAHHAPPPACCRAREPTGMTG